MSQILLLLGQIVCIKKKLILSLTKMTLYPDDLWTIGSAIALGGWMVVTLVLVLR